MLCKLFHKFSLLITIALKKLVNLFHTNFKSQLSWEMQIFLMQSHTEQYKSIRFATKQLSIGNIYSCAEREFFSCRNNFSLEHFREIICLCFLEIDIKPTTFNFSCQTLNGNDRNVYHEHVPMINETRNRARSGMKLFFCKTVEIIFSLNHSSAIIRILKRECSERGKSLAMIKPTHDSIDCGLRE